MTVKKHQVHFDVNATDNTRAGFDSVERNLGRVNNAATRMAATFRGLIGVGVLAGLTREGLQAAMEAERASNRLNAALRATGGAAGIARQEIDKLAESMAESTLFDDDVVRNAAAELVKFGNIHGDVFRRGLELSADLASFMGTDIPQAAQMVGRALQSPTEGVRLLERQFGKLTEAEERNIEVLAEQGRAAEAQNAVLDILRGRVGGVAEEMNTGLTGATSAVAKSWDDMLEGWGRTPALGGAVERALKGVAKGLRELTPGAQAATDPLQAQLRMFDAEIARIERSRPARGRSPLTDERLAELRAQRDALGGQLDAMAFEASLGVAPARAPGPLGGKTSDEATAKKARQEFLKNLKEQGEQAERMAEGLRMGTGWAEEMLSLDEDILKVERLRSEETRRRVQLEGEQAELMAQGLGMGMDWAEQALGAAEAYDVMTAAERRAQEAAQDLGLTFSSAFEDAIVGGEKLSDILKGLEKDIARIIVRQAITKPLAAGVMSALGGAFGGGAVDIPAFDKGTDFVPRDMLAYVHRGEAIIPAGKNPGGSGVTVVQHNTFHSGVSRAEIMPALEQTRRLAVRDVVESIRRGGAVFAAIEN